MNMGNDGPITDEPMVKVTISITRDTHARIKAALSKDKKYRGKLAYFVSDGVDTELSLSEGRMRLVERSEVPIAGQAGTGDGF